jgi:D-amino-acid dehydrogenase
MQKKAIIIGGGIIGLCSAYYLQKEGHHVTIIEKSDGKTGASHINAGYITPSHFIALAAPGIITKGIKWMFNSASPFYVKPRLDVDFLKWSLAFKKSATAKKVEQSTPILKNINLLSRDLYEDLKTSGDFNFHYERKGLLMCYKTDKVGEAEWNVGQRGIEEGLNVKHLSLKEIKAVEPEANFNVKGAVYYDCDAHMTPHSFMSEMTSYLMSKGVSFLYNEEVIDAVVDGSIISKIITNTKELSADELILAAGSWSSILLKKLNIKLHLEAGKGYSINSNQDTKISIPAILCEAKVAITPMDGFTRFAGTMELGGINHKINKIRVNSIANAVTDYYPDIKVSTEEKENAACGLRPCSPDGLPYIGKSLKWKNLTIATGHAMMGWSLGPATGKLVAEIIANEKPSLDLSPFHPERRF